MTASHATEATVGALRAALPYLRLYRGKTFVVKVGGALCASGMRLRRLAEQVGILRELGVRCVLVHGGGPQTTALAQRLGLETRLVDGRRITCEKTLDVAVMTMNGAANTAILAAFRAAGVPAIGVSGVDAACVRAHRRPPIKQRVGEHETTIDYGHVGDIESVDRAVFEKLLDAGFVPILSPVSANDGGALLNVNADTMAAAVAGVMGAEKLILMTEAPGILEKKSDPTTLVSYTDARGLDDLIARGCLDTGMLPKAQAVKAALAQGVRRVHVISDQLPDGLLVEIFTNAGCGTLVVHEIAELSAAEQGQDAPAPAAAEAHA
jgi:acetylglutamate kinase